MEGEGVDDLKRVERKDLRSLSWSVRCWSVENCNGEIHRGGRR